MASCYFNSMKLALENGIRKIAFPSISTGVYAFPVELAAKVAVKIVNRFLQDNPDSFDLVSGCCLMLILRRYMRLRWIRYMNNRNEMSSISVDDFVFVDIIYCEK